MFLQAARSNAVHVLKDILIRFLLNLVLINNQLIAGAKLERQGPPRRSGTTGGSVTIPFRSNRADLSTAICIRPWQRRNVSSTRRSMYEVTPRGGQESISSDECSSAPDLHRVPNLSIIYSYRDTRDYIFYSRGRWFVAFVETDGGARVATLLGSIPNVILLGHETVRPSRSTFILFLGPRFLFGEN